MSTKQNSYPVNTRYGDEGVAILFYCIKMNKRKYCKINEKPLHIIVKHPLNCKFAYVILQN
jgi:hypothetical protein